MTRQRADRTLPTAAGAVVVGSTVLGLLLTAALAGWTVLLFFVPFAGIGTYLVIRRPGNSVGWFLLLMGWGLGLGSMQSTAPVDAMLAGRLTAVEAFAVWANGWGWAPALIAFFGISQVFPSGRIPAGRARWFAWIGFAVLLVIAGLLAIGPTVSIEPAQTGVSTTVPNPTALLPEASVWSQVPGPTDLYPMMFAIDIAGVGALILRDRRSAGLERLQYRWLVTAIVFVVLANGTWVVTALLGADPRGPAYVLTILAYATVPVAIGVAILRYRLYEIDRIISRTIAYLIVTAVLATVFAAGIVLLSTGLASFAQGETIAVAGSTLVAFAIFQPVLRRVRRSVDRRFDRGGYDAQRTAVAFADRLRFETDMEAVTTDLAATARVAVAPASLGLWLRQRDTAR